VFYSYVCVRHITIKRLPGFFLRLSANDENEDGNSEDSEH
jgi:hypothetical protein